MIKSRRKIWAGHVARTKAMRNAYNILVGKPERKRPLEDLDIHGKIILEGIRRNGVGRCVLDACGSE
jgi:hypothetical protein